MRFGLAIAVSLAAWAQSGPLTLPVYEMFRYGAVGQALTHTFVPGGGAPPYRFTVDPELPLPAGYTLDASTGILRGTPAAPGEFRLGVCIEDAARARICVPYLVVVPASAGTTYKEMPPARASVFYQELIEPLDTFSSVEYLPESGALPPGMVLETTGRLYGIPRPPGGAFAFRVRGRMLVTGEEVIRPYLIRVLGPLAATTTVPRASVGVPYSAQLVVLGDRPPHTWSILRGTLPPGFLLEEGGLLRGTSNIAGVYTVTVRVADPSGGSHDREITVIVDDLPVRLEITTGALAPATIGVPYQASIAVSGGRAPYTYRVIGTLPPGISLAASGALSGSPSESGIYTFSIQATDVTGVSALKTFTIDVSSLRYSGANPLEIPSAEPLSVALPVEGGASPVRWERLSGVLPPGVSLSAAGVLTGTTSNPGRYVVVLRMTDAAGRTAQVELPLVVLTPRPFFVEAGVVSAASYAGGTVTPGEIVTIFGERMGPAAAMAFQFDSNGRVPTVLAGVRVYVSGQPAPLVYVSGVQIGAIVPHGAGGQQAADVVVEWNGVRSGTVTVPVTAVLPGIFTANATGTGQAAALNQDGGLNGPPSPARSGEAVVLYGTGFGTTLPAGIDGALVTGELPRPVEPVEVRIGGQPAPVEYAGGAPGLVHGLTQINVRLPGNVAKGPAVPVEIRVGGVAAQTGVTIAIQ